MDVREEIEWLYEYVMLLFKISIVEKKFKLADFLLAFVKEKRSKNVFSQVETNFGDFA